MLSSSRSDPNEALLVTRAVKGDREAFGDLYERHLAAIYRYIYYRVGDVHEAEDMTEIVFLKAWEALDRYRPTQTPFAVWLYRIAHNLIVDRYRTRKGLEVLDEECPDTSIGPEDHAEHREQAEALTEALVQLNPTQQQVLTLRFISGLSHAETAQVVGRTEGAIRIIQHRALAALRALLAEKAGGYGD